MKFNFCPPTQDSKEAEVFMVSYSFKYLFIHAMRRGSTTFRANLLVVITQQGIVDIGTPLNN
jgi:hypothetical protein